MTIEEIRSKWLLDMPSRITSGSTQVYAEWLEELLIEQSKVNKTDICQSVSISLPSDEDISEMADDMMYAAESGVSQIEIYRDGFIAGGEQVRDKIGGNEC